MQRKRMASKSSEADSPHRTGTGPSALPAMSSDGALGNHVTERIEQKRTFRRLPLTPASASLLLFAVISAATGQVMLKHGMQIATARATSSGGSLVLSAVTTLWVPLGLVVFGVSA